MNMRDRLNADLAIALGWLTRLPVRFPAAAADRTLAQALWAFPLVGALLAALVAACFSVLLAAGATGFMAAVLSVGVGVALTGALHEDGLADMLDGLGARGGQDARLAAMRDSRIGTYGVLALILVLMTRVSALSGLPPLHALMALLTACSLGRAAMALVMMQLPLARNRGAAAQAGIASPSGARKALAVGVMIAVIASGVGGLPVPHLLLVIAAGLGAAWLVIHRARVSFGGYTGDVLGATCAVTETTILLAWSLAAG